VFSGNIAGKPRCPMSKGDVRCVSLASTGCESEGRGQREWCTREVMSERGSRSAASVFPALQGWPYNRLTSRCNTHRDRAKLGRRDGEAKISSRTISSSSESPLGAHPPSFPHPRSPRPPPCRPTR